MLEIPSKQPMNPRKMVMATKPKNRTVKSFKQNEHEVAVLTSKKTLKTFHNYYGHLEVGMSYKVTF